MNNNKLLLTTKINKKYAFLLTILATAAADQTIKLLLIQNNLKLPIQAIPKLLNIVAVKNTGMAFGLLTGNNTAFIMLSIAVITAITAIAARAKNKIETTAAALILAGTASNLADRLLRGGVIDYISLKGLPAFNIADAALTTGAALIITAYITQKLRMKRRIITA